MTEDGHDRTQPASGRRPTRRQRALVRLARATTQPALALGVCAAVLVTLGAVAPAQAVEPRPTVEDVPSSAGTDLPTDVIGAPANRNLAPSHQLLFTQNGASSMSSVALPGTDADTGPTADAPLQSFRSSQTAEYPSSAGRFLDTLRDSVLALQLAQAGGQSLIQLAATNSLAETGTPGWNQLNAVDLPQSGDTIVLMAGIGGSDPGLPVVNIGAETSGAVGTQVQTETGLSGTPGYTGQWTVFGDGASGGDGYFGPFSLVSRADGLCLDIATLEDGTVAVVTALCDGSVSQTWDYVDFDDGRELLLVNLEADAPLAIQPGESWQPGTAAPVVVSGPDAITSTVTVATVTDPGPIAPTWSILNPSGDPTAPFDLATGDLDSAVDQSGDFHDEAAVAYLGADGSIQVTVIDYNANGDRQLATTAGLGTAGSGTAGAHGLLTIDAADFDGDGANELAVAFQGADGSARIGFLRYSADPDSGARSLDIVSAGTAVPTGVIDGSLAGLADSTAWDLDGDGLAELYLAVADEVPTLARITVDSSLAITEATSAPLDAGWGDDAGPVAGRPHLSTGVFESAGTDPLGTRQLAVGWWIALSSGSFDRNQLFVPAVGAVSDPEAAIASGAVGSDLTPGGAPVPLIPESILENVLLDPQSPYWDVEPSDGFSMTSGAFAATGPGAPWSVAASGPLGEFAVITPSTGTVSTPLTPTAPTAVPSLTAYDRAGASLVVGPPLVLTVQNLVDLQLVGGQPPTHSDWLDGQFVNVSRNQDFWLQLGSADTDSYDNQSSHESNTTYSISENADVKATASEGFPGIEEGEASLEVKQSFDYSWNTIKSSVSDNSSSTTQTVTQKTLDDDIVNAQVQDFRILRYPVLSTSTYGSTTAGSGCGDGCYGFWDVVLPSAQADVYSVSSSGKALAYFQPSWENGNALSYPEITDDGGVPVSDLGTYTDSSGTTQTSTLFNQSSTVAGTAETAELDIESATSTTTSETSTKSWDVGVDVTAGVSVDAGFGPLGEGTVDASLEGGFNASKASTDTTTGTTSNSHSSTFLLNLPEIDADRGYQVATAYYYSTGGYPKVAHATDLTGDAAGADWWMENYGEQPDLALNLPDDSVLTYDQYNYLGQIEWSDEPSRQLLRGFSATRPIDETSPTTSGAVYATAPSAGDPVFFNVDVHNYSLTALDEAFTVDFYAVPVDADGLDVTGEATHISTQTVDGIAARDTVTVTSSQWDAVGPATGPGLQNWRVFVVLDEDDTVAEVHEWQSSTDQAVCPAASIQDGSSLIDPMTGAADALACGQNNQGYGVISVLAAQDADGADPSDAAGRAGVRLSGAGLTTGDPADLELGADSPMPRVVAGQSVTGIVHATSESDSDDHQLVLVFDGTPEDGELVAATYLQGVSAATGGHASYKWTPTTPGVHELHQVVLGTADAGDRHEQIVRVEVEAAPGGDPTPSPPATPPSTPTAPAPGADGGSLAATGFGGLSLAALAAMLLAAGGAVLIRRGRRRAG